MLREGHQLEDASSVLHVRWLQWLPCLWPKADQIEALMLAGMNSVSAVCCVLAAAMEGLTQGTLVCLAHMAARAVLGLPA